MVPPTHQLEYVLLYPVVDLGAVALLIFPTSRWETKVAGSATEVEVPIINIQQTTTMFINNIKINNINNKNNNINSNTNNNINSNIITIRTKIKIYATINTSTSPKGISINPIYMAKI